MFDLDSAIEAWRQQMLAAGIREPSPLAELEAHLREEIRQQMNSGMDGQQAFEISARGMGQAKLLESEFRKAERTFVEQIIKIGTGVVGFLAGGLMMIPACVQINHELVVADGKLALLLLGWAVVTWSLGRMIQLELHKREFEWETVEMSLMKRLLKAGSGIFCAFIGVALMIPAALQALRADQVKFDALCYLVFGVALLITGSMVAYCPYKKRAA
ncbi:MAG: hypothetical protein ABSE48_04720 [Verrucomicrobiota bacterium]|jgi:hypothetical protein